MFGAFFLHRNAFLGQGIVTESLYVQLPAVVAHVKLLLFPILSSV